MKKSAYIFSVITGVWLCVRVVHAMDPAPAQEQTYSFVGIISPQYATDMITFIKKFPDYRLLVVVDKHGLTELLDMSNNFKQLIRFQWRSSNYSPGTLRNVFMHHDESGQKLLIASPSVPNNELCVYNMETKDTGWLFVGHPFNLYQQSDNALIMVNLSDNAAYEIKVSWEQVHNQLDTPEKVLFIKNQSFEWKGQGLDDEGLIAGYSPTLDVPQTMFDTSSIPQELRKHLGFTSATGKFYLSSIYSFHRTTCGTLFIGQDGGRVSIWKPTKEETL